MTKSKQMCRGCYDDAYNHGLGGAEGCWGYDGAEIVNKIEIPVDLAPPYDKSWARPVLSCFRRQRFVQVRPEALTEDGYWRT